VTGLCLIWQLNEVIPDFLGKLDRLKESYERFLAAFEARAIDGKLSKVTCIDLATDLSIEVL
jgi:hypothetical protein